MPKLTLEERRLQTLRRQLTGKNSNQYISNQTVRHLTTDSAAPLRTGEAILTTDYLKKDLLKIAYLSFGAVALELTIFFASRNHLFRLNI